MSRDWIAVYGRLIRLPKFRRLPESAQLSLVYVWALAGDQTPEATWASADNLCDLLVLHGRENAADDVEALRTAGWLDPREGDRVAVHDWDHHQYAASKAIQRVYEADRKADWRLRKKVEGDMSGTSPDDSRTPVKKTGQDRGEDEKREDDTPKPGDSLASKPARSRPGSKRARQDTQRLLDEDARARRQVESSKTNGADAGFTRRQESAIAAIRSGEVDGRAAADLLQRYGISEEQIS